MLTNRLAQSATNRKMLRQPSLRFDAMTERNWRRTGSRTRAFRESKAGSLTSVTLQCPLSSADDWQPIFRMCCETTASSNIRAVSPCPGSTIACRRCDHCCRYLFLACRKGYKVESIRPSARSPAVAALEIPLSRDRKHRNRGGKFADVHFANLTN